MAYNPYEAVKMIYNLKNDWDNYTSAGNTTDAGKIKESAKKYYDELMQYGYGDVANTLSNQNYKQAQETYNRIASQYAPQNTAPAASPAPKLSLNQAQINALLTSQDQSPQDFQAQYNARNDDTWNTLNSLYGYSTPEGQTEHTKYTDFNSYLENMIKDTRNYSSPESDELRAGTTQRNQQIQDWLNEMANMQRSSSQGISDKNNQLWNTVTGDKEDMSGRYNRLEEYNYSNPFTSEQGKSILERYDLAGLQGRDNEAAAGGAGNSGNIDSYSAANALRQQASLRNLGEQTALAAHSRTVNDGRGILSDRGQYNQGIYNNMQNAINTDISQSEANMSRWKELLNTGMTQDQRLWENAENRDARLFDQNNMLINTGMDFNNKRFENNESREGRMFDQEYSLLKTGMNYNQQLWNNNESREGRLFNEGETTLNNAHYREQDALNQGVNRDVTRSEVTGNVMPNMVAYNMGLIDEKGKLKNSNVDFKAKINELTALLDKTTNPVQRQNILSEIEGYKYARNIKVGMDEYKQYAGDVVGAGLSSAFTPTAANNQFNQNLAANQSNVNKQFALDEKSLNANIDYNKASLEWQKEVGRLEYDYKNKGLTQDAINFAMGISRDQYIAELNSSVSMDANNVQRELAKSQERIASIQAQVNRYGIDGNTQLALAELAQNEQQFQATLTENARQYDNTDAYNRWLAELSKTVMVNTNNGNTNADSTADGEITGYIFEGVSQSAAKAHGVDDNGWKLLQTLQEEADKNGGRLEENQIFEIAVNTSNANNTNLDQIKRVYKYLGLDTYILDNVKDAGLFPWQWSDGVKPK